jgi:macrolide transport system ATP-binding/permease protein
MLLEINSEGTALIIVTHDPGIAALMRRTILLRDGRIEADQAVPAASEGAAVADIPRVAFLVASGQ